MFKKLQIMKYYLGTKLFFNRRDVEEYQKKKLSRLLKNLKSDFYPKSQNLKDFPIINKKTFMENFDRINTLDISQKDALSVALQAEDSRDFSSKIGDITVGLSSGTSGSRGVFLVSEEESARWAGYILRRMLPKPLLQKHKIAFFLRANSNLYESVGSSIISFTFYDLLTPLKEHIGILNKTQPSILIAPAQVLRLLAQSDTLTIKPKKIISVAEVLEEDDREIIEIRFSQPVHQVYQCTEGFLAHTCKEGNLHLNEDIVLVEKEWIDKKSFRFIPIVTDLNRTTQPVIRYRLDDVLILDEEVCSCGSAFTCIKRIEGRCDDILKMCTVEDEEYLLFPDFIRRAIIFNNANINEYKVIKEGDTLHIYIDPISVKNEVEEALSKLYITHNLKPLKHIFHMHKIEELNKKRRRVQQL
ncbi:F390 synthetase-related protein [Sulfurimonas sp.]|uniref:F390 synthetase-related protein n=1 Tax=Sulfurimonas sp. TaxID=2022749 RepID=UPI002639E4D9|nr:F390 synthetase-related protein [Sulfurimonas sp.]MCW8895464.1 adenylate synthase [Sulfurimonas sp.]